MSEEKSNQEGLLTPKQGVKYSAEVLKNLSDIELHQKLCDEWGFSNKKITVWARLRRVSGVVEYTVDNIHHALTNERLEYPYDAKYPLRNGVFISKSAGRFFFKDEEDTYIKAELELSPKRERDKHNNPFELNVVSSSVELLVELPIDITEHKNILENTSGMFFSNDVEVFISQAVYDRQLSKMTTDFEVIKQRHEDELTSSVDKIKRTIEENEKENTNLVETISENHEKNKLLRLENKQTEKIILEQKETTERYRSEIQELKVQLSKLENDMSQKIERLKNYVVEKAGFLKDFEFIDEDVYFQLTEQKTDQDIDRSNFLSFINDFEADYGKVAAYLQAYLKDQGQYYSRHIVENYLTLLRTNDLIILAGDSGSGKTSLVQSFAKAVGGVAKIIPVKPNWTSSEDLLGYYNPLEKKYLATPFLEALLEASQYPDVPYFICLDEMNLARVEYYFADFLSKLEERKEQPQIQLYSDDEAAHVLSELKGVVSIISDAKDKFSKNGIVDFVALMQDEEINTEMKRAFGFSDKDSLIKYHGDIRRMLSGVLGIPSTITIPNNVRIIGAINIDETTHYLSPKILDRAHIMKFQSPLLTDWDAIEQEIASYDFEDVSKPVEMGIANLGVRESYPNFTPSDEFCRLFTKMNRDHFNVLGVEFGMRTIRQGLNYRNLFKDVQDDDKLIINNFLLHKVLPKFTFDGTKPVGDFNKLEHIEHVFLTQVEELVDGLSIVEEFSVVESIKAIAKSAAANDDVVNYWA
ncbi:McrB family protein [Aliivibrio fischeri]|uniref:McrB family protein n=1 Tax=Aliivibrio fischeri TaxID=668 RepID=UPI0012DA26BE|nr:AAA family ATPase [Aliivibrio fischeri]MUK68987.1 AAA domain-containing protein [Aliivibrio fischeri]MUK71978.1 AAA domain-containing protein [Aliivibrio fischeri]